MCEQIAQRATRGIFYPGADHADVLQEARIGVWEALRDFDLDGGASFETFAGLCARRQVFTGLRSAAAVKHRTLTDAASLDAPIAVEDGEGTLGDVTVHPSADPCAVVIALDEVRRVFARFERLSPFERKCAERVLLGGGEQDAAGDSRVDKAVHRARLKLRAAA